MTTELQTTQTKLTQEVMKHAYLEYAGHVIGYRAIPSMVDGLKVVQRRILVTMKGMGLTHNVSFRKSASIVGSTLAQLHPHGDTAVYDAMVNMARTFTTRYPLVKGQGNFGSLDGDGSAAMRYTEAKMSSYASVFFSHWKKNTVPTRLNYDDSISEPIYLPATLPNLLINGVTGIAVGVSTNIPPHNLKEVLEATIHLLENPNATIVDLLDYIKGPDIPCGGIISSPKDLYEIYEKGKGSFTIQASHRIEGKKIIFENIPYQVSKTQILEKIKLLISEKKIPQCISVQDESDRHGTRVAINTMNNSNKDLILNNIFKLTDMRTKYHVQFYALDNEENVQLYNLKSYLKSFLSMQYEFIITNHRERLQVAKEKLNRYNGQLIAQNNIDEVIRIIRTTDNPQDEIQRRTWVMTDIDAINSLGLRKNKEDKHYANLSRKQTQYIVNMPIKQLGKLAKNELIRSIETTIKEISFCRDFIQNKREQNNYLKQIFRDAIEKYDNNRRTQIIERNNVIYNRDLIPSRPCIIIFDKNQYLRRLEIEEYRIQHRNGVGRKGDKERILSAVISDAKDYILCCSGRSIYRIDCFQIEPGSHQSRGRSINQIIPSLQEEKVYNKILYMTHMPHKNCPPYMMIIMQDGTIRRHSSDLIFKNKVRKNGKIFQSKNNVNTVVKILFCSKEDQLLITTHGGQIIRINVAECSVIKNMQAIGYRGCRLKNKDRVIDACISTCSDTDEILTVFSSGQGRISKINEYRKTNRGTKGVLNTRRKKSISAISIVKKNMDELMIITEKQQAIRIKVNEIARSSRTSRGIDLINNFKTDPVVAILPIIQKKEEQ